METTVSTAQREVMSLGAGRRHLEEAVIAGRRASAQLLGD